MCPQNLAVLALLSFAIVHLSMAQTHDEVMGLFKDKFANYHTEVRPMKDQSNVLYVDFYFEIVSILEVNDVSQNFICNGYFGFFWLDEIIQWDPANYGGQSILFPKAKTIWRPRIVLINTLNDRDLFGDDQVPTLIMANGSTAWFQGTVFPTTCQMDLTDFPFDEQTCNIDFMAMSHHAKELQYKAIGEAAQLSFYTPNGEWELVGSNITIFNTTVFEVSSFRISIKIKRHPTYLLMNVLLPVICLSALNLLVFFIPAESGEKVSYGITVLLALAVYLSVVSGMLPRTPEDSMPKVTIYMFMLLIISLLTVVDSIAIVYLHYLEEREEKHLKIQQKVQSAVSKLIGLRHSSKSSADSHITGPGIPGYPWPNLPREEMNNFNSNRRQREENRPKRNKYKLVGKHIDMVSFVVFLLIWLVVTISFLIAITC